VVLSFTRWVSFSLFFFLGKEEKRLRDGFFLFSFREDVKDGTIFLSPSLRREIFLFSFFSRFYFFRFSRG